MRRIRSFFATRVSSILLAAYSGCGLFMISLLSGVYYWLYAPILQDKVGPSLLKAVVFGGIGGTAVFFAIFLTTNAAFRRKNSMSRTSRAVFGLLNTAELFGTGAATLYVTDPALMNIVLLGILFVTCGVVGVSTSIALYDWRLSDLVDKDVTLKDLQFIFDDSLQSVNLTAWASIVFLSSGVVAALIGYQRKYPSVGSAASAAYDTILLYFFVIIFIGIGVWLGWITPLLHRLEEIRLELRKLDKRLLQDKGRAKSDTAAKS